MTRRGSAKRVDRSQAAKYMSVGRAFLSSAQALSTVADGDEGYGNAIALLAVHACVSLADALAIGYAEVKSTAGDHAAVVPMLRDIFRQQLPADVEKALRSVVTSKDEIAYQGRYYPLQDGQRLLARAEAFSTWATRVYEERPTTGE